MSLHRKWILLVFSAAWAESGGGAFWGQYCHLRWTPCWHTLEALRVVPGSGEVKGQRLTDCNLPCGSNLDFLEANIFCLDSVAKIRTRVKICFLWGQEFLIPRYYQCKNLNVVERHESCLRLQYSEQLCLSSPLLTRVAGTNVHSGPLYTNTRVQTHMCTHSLRPGSFSWHSVFNFPPPTPIRWGVLKVTDTVTLVKWSRVTEMGS